MKTKICISIEESAVAELEKLLKNGLFRNKSHLIEYAVTKFMKEKEIAK